jgi:hypothetical protein
MRELVGATSKLYWAWQLQDDGNLHARKQESAREDQESVRSADSTDNREITAIWRFSRRGGWKCAIVIPPVMDKQIPFEMCFVAPRCLLSETFLEKTLGCHRGY